MSGVDRAIVGGTWCCGMLDCLENGEYLTTWFYGS